MMRTGIDIISTRGAGEKVDDVIYGTGKKRTVIIKKKPYSHDYSSTNSRQNVWVSRGNYISSRPNLSSSYRNEKIAHTMSSGYVRP